MSNLPRSAEATESSIGEGKQALEEETVAPVIHRWQDLPRSFLYPKMRIHKAPDPPREKTKKKKGKMNKEKEKNGIGKRCGKENKGKGNWKGKEKNGTGKRSGKENKGKVEVVISEDKEGPPLFNYIMLNDLYSACKMCPNPDGHKSVCCSNLTPELKEMFKKERTPFKRDIPDICDFCLKKNDHFTWSCPYGERYPPGARLGPLAQLRCYCCGDVLSHPSVPDPNWTPYHPGPKWSSRAIFKYDPSIIMSSLTRTLEEEAAADSTDDDA